MWDGVAVIEGCVIGSTTSVRQEVTRRHSASYQT